MNRFQNLYGIADLAVHDGATFCVPDIIRYDRADTAVRSYLVGRSSFAPAEAHRRSGATRDGTPLRSVPDYERTGRASNGRL